MDALQFAYWLQGFAELSGEAPPTEAQWQSIREHLATVFNKVTPPVQVPGAYPNPLHGVPVELGKALRGQPARATC